MCGVEDGIKIADGIDKSKIELISLLDRNVSKDEAVSICALYGEYLIEPKASNIDSYMKSVINLNVSDEVKMQILSLPCKVIDIIRYNKTENGIDCPKQRECLEKMCNVCEDRPHVHEKVPKGTLLA